MKKEFRIISFVKCIIKKKFFNNEKNDIYQDCKSVLDNNIGSEENEVEEYLKNYQSTTRWQTI